MNKKGTRMLASATALGIVLTMLPSGNVKAAPGDVNKVPGKDRYETAANVATANWKEGAENVIIASGEGYADSLSASVLAKKLNAPIILTKSGELHKSAKETLKTLKAKNFYVIGGNASVSQSIRDDLKKEGYALTELGGKNRFETNLAIANYLVEEHNVKADEILVVNGKDGFSDALSAAPVAAAKGQILLIVGKDPSTADLASKFIQKHNSKVTAIGTEGVIPKAVYDKLGAKERVTGGANRFETNLNIMKYFKLNTDKLYVANATGDGYADALVASALAGRTASQLILTHTKDSQETKNAIDHIKSIKNDKTEVGLVGGDSVIPQEVVNKIKEVVKEENIKNPEKPSRPSKPSKPTEPEKNKFEIIWSFADVDEDLDVNTTNGKDDAQRDYVYIKFNKPISVSGEANNVLNTSNYKLNKMSLPKGTEIKPNIKGLDDADKVTDSITIVLPNEYLNGKNEPHIITISSYLESSTTGEVLTNGGDKILTWSADGKEIFNALLVAEKQIYLAEVTAKKDLALKDNLINAEKALETAKASINSLNNKTSGKSALEERVSDVEKTVKDARIKFDEKTDFEFSNGKITKYIGNETDIVIPETIRGEKVTAIEDSAFKNKNLTSVKIPKTVESIGMQAFAKNNLTSIELPESLKDMGNIAFMDNKLASVKIPKNLINIPTGAFSKNQITSVLIPDGVTTIGRAAFMDNSLETIIIPSTVESIGGTAFSSNKLKSVTIPSSVKNIGKDAFAKNENVKLTYSKLVEVIEYGEKIKTDDKSEEKIKLLKEAIEAGNNLNKKPNATLDEVNKAIEEIDNAIETLVGIENFEFSDGRITKYIGTETDITIPRTIKGEKVTTIGNGAFANKKLTSVNIPQTVEIIEMQAFAKNNLTSIELPESLKSMGNIAFMGNKLTSVRIPKNLTIIPSSAFSKNEISSVVISEGVTEIALSAFAQNKLESIVIPSTVEFIRNKAFSGNQLKIVNIPSNVKDIGKDAFDNNKNIKLVYSKLIEAIKRAESIKTKGKEADKVKVLKEAIEEGNKLNDKSNATLEEVNKVVESINNAIEALNKESSKTTIKQIKPLGIKNIDVDFGTTEANVKAKLPKKITIVDSKDKEHNIDINWSILKYNGNIAADYTATGILKLPEGVLQSNPETDLKVTLKVTVTPKGVENKEWEVKDFTFKGTAITGFAESGKEKFKNNKDLILPKTNQFGEKINEIADEAFCSEFEIKGDSNESFKDKDKAKQDPKIGINSVIIPDTVKIIGKEAFRNNCLTDINIPESVTTIKGLAFNNNKLKTLTIPDSVTELGNGAFTLNDIADLKLSKELKTIPVAFGYNNLVSVTIPEGVTRIEDMAFSDNKLAQVTLPTTLEYLSGFNNNNLKSINIPTSVTELGKKAFARNKISSVKIPGNVKKIGVSAFQNTWHDTFLTSITIKDGVEKIDEYAFSLNHLKDVNIPKSVKELAPNAFHKNLGYDGVVHLFTDNYNNPNNLKESKYQVIDPAKLTIKYRSEDKTLKEEEIWKIGKKEGEEKYLHIGDKAVEITPKYEDNEYELENTDARKVDLNHKENELIVECKKKDSVDKIMIKSIGEVAPVVVDFGTEQNIAMDKLSKSTYIVDSNGENHEVKLNWTIKNYSGNVSGEYNAIGTFKLPQGISQSEPEITLEVQGKIIVKEDFENIQDSKWEVEDFNFEGTTLAGFSDKGEEKLKTNKDLILPKVNDKGEAITKVKNYAFAKNGLTSLAIPKGLNGLVIGTNAFEENQINTLYISEGVKEIDAYAFSKNKLKYVDFPGTLKKIGNHAFADNQLVSAIFSEETNMIAIDRFSFANNKITSITLLNDVTKVNGEAFKDNKSYNSDGKVHIFTKSFDPNNSNQWFPDSQYHKVIVIGVESIKEIQPIEVNLGTQKNNIKVSAMKFSK
ncbi:MAG: cell wall-binding repeat-containing protein [Clostridium botulinum]|nr:cell wall-binding repeat-containing protein [Clostridium botulinum]